MQCPFTPVHDFTFYLSLMLSFNNAMFHPLCIYAAPLLQLLKFMYTLLCTFFVLSRFVETTLCSIVKSKIDKKHTFKQIVLKHNTSV